MMRLSLDRTARMLAGVSLGVLALAALLPAFVPALRSAPAEVAEFCRAALVAAFPLLTPVRSHLALLPVGLAVAGLAVAAADRVRQQLRLRRFLAAHRTRALTPDDPLQEVARNARVHRRVRIIEGPAAMPAFTAGFLRPRIYISRELYQALDGAELAAAFLHELEHLRRRDPLRLATIRFLERALFWLPLARSLADAAAEAVELRADDAAGRIGRLELAGAIVKTARLARGPVPAAVPGLGRTSAVRRARRLLGEPLPRPRVPTLRLAVSVLALSLVWASALFAGGAHRHDEAGPPCNVCVVRQMAHRFGLGF